MLRIWQVGSGGQRSGFLLSILFLTFDLLRIKLKIFFILFFIGLYCSYLISTLLSNKIMKAF